MQLPDKSDNIRSVSIIIDINKTIDIPATTKTIQSINSQSYKNWEAILIFSGREKSERFTIPELNDSRFVKLICDSDSPADRLNKAVDTAKGEFITFLGQEDHYSSDTLYKIVNYITNCKEEVKFIYSDEDQFIPDGSEYCNFLYKPDYSPDLLLSQPYILNSYFIRKDLFDEIGGFRKEFTKSEVYDLVLKVSEKEKIHHIDECLYHCKAIPDTAKSIDVIEAQKRAIEDALKRRNIKGEVFAGKFPGTYRVKRQIKGNPLVSIIIPFKNKPALLSTCLDSILEQTTWKNLEIICIDNQSDDPEISDLIKYYENKDKRVKFYSYDKPFNYSKINNYAVGLAKGEHLLFLNNDIIILTPEWIENMLEHSQREEVGAVGAKLLFPDNTIQHFGIFIDERKKEISHAFVRVNNEEPGYASRLHCIQNFSAIMAACLIIKKDLFIKAGKFNETSLQIAYNDIHLCFDLMEQGYLNVVTPYSQAYHLESVSRGYENTPEKITRHLAELCYLRAKHNDLFNKKDPYYSSKISDFVNCLKTKEKKEDSLKSYNSLKKYLKDKNFQSEIDLLSSKYKDKKILVYGAGILFSVLKDNFDLSNLNIVAVSDKKFSDNNIKEYNGYQAVNPENINSINPDVVLIALYSYKHIKTAIEDKLNCIVEPFHDFMIN